MKNILYKTVIMMSFSLLMGCEDILNTEPVNNLNRSTFWLSQKDAEYSLNGIYGYLPDYTEIYLDKVTDIAFENLGLSHFSTIEKSEHNSETAYFNTQWDASYRCIRAVNFFLENSDNILENDPTYSEELNARFRAEARFIRSFQYLRLAMFFGDVPLVINTLDVNQAVELTRTPVDQIWDFISSELTEVANILPSGYSDPNDKGRVTKGAALALKARAMLCAERYTEAATAARQVMDLNVYSLYPDYAELFSYEGQGNSEVIFDHQYSKDIFSYPFYQQNGPLGINAQGNMAVTRNLVDAYPTVNGLPITMDNTYNEFDPYRNRDPRLAATVYLPAFSDDIPGDMLDDGSEDFDPRPGSGTTDEINVDYQRTKTGFGVRKYLQEEDYTDRTNCGTNFILIRYADVLLIYAEAMLEANQIDESVYEALDEVRGRVGFPPLARGQSVEGLRQIIRNERMVEFGLEGLRLFDIRRWRIAEDVMTGTIPGFRYIAPGESNITEYDYPGVVRVFDPVRDYLWPIPFSEITLNPNLSQNDGY
ncbi:RagB/SusD family nutrient uptake outer membrane protein [Echinicola sp. CAU 1574]|uniref:RagB/SusD family nutrient uptake outer membrane protein n=1 Tax=Echinicola arenosa TaxID=2774144 RepID=A0ABR9AF94_9BACT|nr:RagB/SusD family nutrient uptake outer membrane protein [Echinicola arenosa]MBD8487351.1 RagB/SusD family nutrient uptake outer membrane protein [Echinicola arenosa]